MWTLLSIITGHSLTIGLLYQIVDKLKGFSPVCQVCVLFLFSPKQTPFSSPSLLPQAVASQALGISLLDCKYCSVVRPNLVIFSETSANRWLASSWAKTSESEL